MELLGKVRRMHYRDGLSRSEIARRTGLSRNTVKKWLTAPEAVEPRYRRVQAPGKWTPSTVRCCRRWKPMRGARSATGVRRRRFTRN